MKRPKPENRCPECKVNHQFCYCGDVVSVPTHSHVTLLIHHREKHLTTNTAFLAKRVLKNSSLYFRGIQGQSIDEMSFEVPGHRSLLLFPDEQSHAFDENFMEKHPGPYNIIVPDGSWSQARKFKKRMSYLQTIPSIHLPFTYESEYYLRKQTKKENLCTYEAIARSLGVCEGAQVSENMLQVFRSMVSSHLSSRSSNYMPYNARH